MRSCCVMALLLLVGAASARAQAHQHSNPSSAASDSIPPERTLLRFFVRGPVPSWHTGRVGWILDSRQGRCPAFRSDDSERGLYLVGGVDSLQVVDSTDATASPRFRPLDLVPIKAKYGWCGIDFRDL